MGLLSDEGVKFVQIPESKSKSDFFSYTYVLYGNIMDSFNFSLSGDAIKSVLLDAEQLEKFVNTK